VYFSIVDCLKIGFKLRWLYFLLTVKEIITFKIELTYILVVAFVHATWNGWYRRDFVTEFLFVKMVHFRKVVALKQMKI
jgi:hypothetical protein